MISMNRMMGWSSFLCFVNLVNAFKGFLMISMLQIRKNRFRMPDFLQKWLTSCCVHGSLYTVNQFFFPSVQQWGPSASLVRGQSFLEWCTVMIVHEKRFNLASCSDCNLCWGKCWLSVLFIFIWDWFPRGWPFIHRYGLVARISALLTTFCWRNHLMFHGLGCVMLLRFVICDFSLWFVVLFLFRDPAGFFRFFGSTFWLGLRACLSFLLFLISGFMMCMLRNVMCVTRLWP